MDASLDIERLREALGDHTWREAGPNFEGGRQVRLPTPEQLRTLMAAAETQLFINQRELPDELLHTAWYLHGVAAADSATELFTFARQQRAFAISAHLFDLALSGPRITTSERLRYTFAAQVGYLRSDQQPNAQAVSRRVLDTVEVTTPSLLDSIAELGCRAGVSFLSFDLPRTRNLLRRWRSQFRQLADQVDLQGLQNTIFSAPFCVVEAISELVQFLTAGDRERLATAIELLDTAVRDPISRGDYEARWVASHLRFIADELDAGSLWTILPPDLPKAVQQAFTYTNPPILTLWKPQRELLSVDSIQDSETEKQGASPLSPESKRMILSVPTSAGKTLLAQLVMLTHLATAGSGVCYVTPQRSLGREVRAALRGRLGFLARRLERDIPDFGLPEDSALLQFLRAEYGDTIEDSEGPTIQIITPERLSFAIRQDPEKLLSTVGLFVFDEAHLMGEQSRGFTLEAALSFIHWRTQNTNHRIALLSAALGNQAQLTTWLGADTQGTSYRSTWRGPRRLHAIFNTEINRSATPRIEAVNAKGKTAYLVQRHFLPSHGIVRLLPAEGQSEVRLQTTDSVGHVAFRADARGVRQSRPEKTPHSTARYKMHAQLIAFVGHGGPVLVVTESRPAAKRMAEALANDLPDRATAQVLSEVVGDRLGTDHPLVPLLKKGVAYHHAGLPVDILTLIEEGLRADAIRYLTATTTLTEGVNLPVRTVVLAENRYEGQEDDPLLSGARLVNAMGRAGRACKETEGWVVLIQNKRELASDFEFFRPDNESLQVNSQLGDETALLALADFEETLRAGSDAILSATDQVSDFISFVWFILASEEQLSRVGDRSNVAGALSSTFAFSQLPEDVRARWENVASIVATTYNRTDSAARQRWARTGTSIPSSEKLDELARLIAPAVVENPSYHDDPRAALDLLRSHSVIEVFFSLAECQTQWSFRKTVGDHARSISIDVYGILQRWMGGPSIPELAHEFLGEVTDKHFRTEQMVDTISQHFEHFLSWMLGAFISLVQQHLPADGSRVGLCPELPLYVRYGVNSPQAIELALGGVHSRDLVNRIAAAACSEKVQPGGVYLWLGSSNVTIWRSRFGASATDVVELLEFTRARGSSIMRNLLEGGQVRIDVTGSTLSEIPNGTPLVLNALQNHGVIVLTVPGETNVLAEIPTPLQPDVQVVLDTGVEIAVSVSDGQVLIELESGVDDPAPSAPLPHEIG